MAGALAQVLAETKVQVLWKFNKDTNYSDDFFAPLKLYSEQGRLRMSNWLKADPFALLNTGHVAVSVHHGGANCYNEAIA